MARIRKSAPTVRERVEATQAGASSKRPSRIKGALSRTKKVVPKLPDSGPTRAVAGIGRSIAKVLGWLVPRYFVNSWREVRQVTWPTRRETWRLTLAVFVFATVFGAMVAVVDKGLDELFKKVVLK